MGYKTKTQHMRVNTINIDFYSVFFLYIINIIIQITVIPLFSTPTFGDGINPLALGFKLRGDDWTSYLMADGYYYKYGQMLFYLPFIVLIKNNVVLYRVLLLINSLLISLIPVCAFQIVTKYLNCVNKKVSWGIALLIGVIPAVTLNSKYTWSEPILMLIPWLIMLLFMKAMEKENSRKEKRLYGLLIGILQTYAYMVHNRGIVILIASLLCVLLIRFMLKEKCISMFSYLSATIGLCMLDLFMAPRLKEYLYGTGANLIGEGKGIINKGFIKNLFSETGLKTIGEEFAGWIFANASSTLGLSVLGIVISFFVIIHFWRFLKDSKKEFILVFFSLLCFLGALALGSLFFFNDLFAAADMDVAKRGDKLIYTRYLDGAGVCISFIGLYFLLCRREKWIKNCILYSGLLFFLFHGFFVSRIATRINDTITWSLDLMLISYFCNLKQTIRGGSYTTIGFLSGGIAFWGLFGILFFGVLMTYFKNKRRFFLAVYIAAFLLCYFWNSYNSIFRQDRYVKNIMDECREIISCAENQELKNIYLDDEILRCAFQYTFSDYYVITRRDNNRHSINQMFILSPKSEYNHELYAEDYYEIINNGINENSDYHLYIKGEQLNDMVNSKGILTEKLQYDDIAISN